MVTLTLERNVGQSKKVKCANYMCENLVDISGLETADFRGYQDPSSGRVYCCKRHYDIIILKEAMMEL
jgi:hypothetical protein